jgi:nucleotidyltransferase substrate binding protein (TIGR01987 family)
MHESKFELLYNDLGKAIKSNNDALAQILSEFNPITVDLILNGRVQKFEYNIELLWKTIKAFFAEGRSVDIIYPREVFKRYFEEESITEETYLVLLDALKSRNALSHIYKEEIFIEIQPKLKDYAAAIEATYKTLKLSAI